MLWAQGASFRSMLFVQPMHGCSYVAPQKCKLDMGSSSPISDLTHRSPVNIRHGALELSGWARCEQEAEHDVINSEPECQRTQPFCRPAVCPQRSDPKPARGKTRRFSLALQDGGSNLFGAILHTKSSCRDCRVWPAPSAVQSRVNRHCWCLKADAGEHVSPASHRCRCAGQRSSNRTARAGLPLAAGRFRRRAPLGLARER